MEKHAEPTNPTNDFYSTQVRSLPCFVRKSVFNWVDYGLAVEETDFAMYGFGLDISFLCSISHLIPKIVFFATRLFDDKSEI